MMGTLCGNAGFHIRDWCEYILRPWRGRPQPNSPCWPNELISIIIKYLYRQHGGRWCGALWSTKVKCPVPGGAPAKPLYTPVIQRHYGPERCHAADDVGTHWRSILFYFIFRTDGWKEPMWADKLESTTIISYVISKFKDIRHNANVNAGASQMLTSRLAQAVLKIKYGYTAHLWCCPTLTTEWMSYCSTAIHTIITQSSHSTSA